MKKYLIILVVLFSSCNMYNKVADNYYSGKVEKSRVKIFYHESFNELKEIYEIFGFVHYAVKYEKDSIWDKWKTAIESFYDGYGDCEDRARLFLNILYVRFNIKGDLILLDTSSTRAIGKGGYINHAVVRFNDYIVDPVSQTLYKESDIAFYYTFDELFNETN